MHSVTFSTGHPAFRWLEGLDGPEEHVPVLHGAAAGESMLTSLLIIAHALQSAEGKAQSNTVELIRQDAVPVLPATTSPAAREDSGRTSCSELSY